MIFQGLALARVLGVLCLKKLVDIGFMGAFAVRDAGGSPAASYFLCFAKESNQRKATRGSSPRKGAGYPALLETTGRCGTRARMNIAHRPRIPLALKQSSRTSPVASALLGDSHRDPVVLRRPLKKSVSPASLKGLPSVAAGAQFICDCPWQT